jgi:dolichyl-phosphate beta-glucosyltransferase
MINKISIIFPIYNEEKRLAKSLIDIEKFIKLEKSLKTQIIFVNDGSKDRSLKLLLSFKKKIKKKNIKITIIDIKKNVGKGRAISQGIAQVLYSWVLTSDIDMSVKLKQFTDWKKQKFIKKNYSVYIGSRAHKKSIVKKTFLRHMLGLIMGYIVNFLFNLNHLDTQCGFKLYKKEIAKKAFNKLIRPRYEHDVEVMIRLKLKKIEVIELPVKWVHKPNSKLNIIYDPIKMFIGILILKLNYSKN